MSEVMAHNKLNHTSNVQYCKHFLEGVCHYGENCWFVHSDILKNSKPGIKCKFCEEKFRTKNSLKEHMKEIHIISISKCKNENECKYGPRKCRFTHKENIKIAYENAKNEEAINFRILNSTLNTS